MKSKYKQQYDEIQLRLRRIHNLRRAIQFARGTGLTLLVISAALGVIAACDHFLHWSLATRLVIAVAYYALLFLLGWRWIAQSVRRCGGLERTARLVESRYADMDQSLMGAVQFADPVLEQGRAETPEVFIEGMVGDAHGKMPEVKSRRLVRWTEAVAAALLLLLPLALILFSFLQFPDFSKTYALRLLLPGWGNPLPVAGIDIRVAPGDARLLKGEQLAVTVRAAGLGGRPAILKVRPSGARYWREEILPGTKSDVRIKIFPNVSEDFQYRVKVARDETPVYTVEIIRVPEIVEFAMTYRFPAYTGLDQRQLKAASGDITAPAGTEVDVEVSVDRPLSKARVQFETGEPIVLKPSGADRFRFTLRVQEPLRYRITLEDVKGVAGQSPIWYVVKPLPDKPPTIKLELPTDNIRATVVAEVPVVFKVEDDYGFSMIRLRYAIDDQDEQFVDFDAAGKKVLHAEYLFQMENMNLKPGAQILYSIEALDNDTLAKEQKGACKRAASELMFIMIQFLNQEYAMLGGEAGGGAAVVKTDIIAAQRAVLRNTWPFIEPSDEIAGARAGMSKVGEAQLKVRAKAMAAVVTMRAKKMSPKAIAAMEKSIPLMEQAAAELAAGAAPKAFRFERAALAALLESYDYSVAKMESGGASVSGAKTGEKLEEIAIKSASRFAPDEKKKADQFMASLADEIGRMQEEQENIRKDMAAVKPLPKKPAGAPQPAGTEPQNKNELTPGQNAQNLKERQEKMTQDAEDLARKIDKQAAAQKAAAPLREIGDLLDKTREAMQGAVDALGQPEAADEEIPQLAKAQENAQKAVELLAEAVEKAGDLAGKKGGHVVEKALKDLEALRADFEKKRAEAAAGEKQAAGEKPGKGEDPGEGDNQDEGEKPGAGGKPDAGKKPMGAKETAERLEKIAEHLETDSDEQGQSLAKAAKAAADSLRKSEKPSPGEGGGSAKKPSPGKKEKDEGKEGKEGLGRGLGSAGGMDKRGSEGDPPDEGVGSGLTSRTLDELVSQFLMTPLLKEQAKQKAENRERPSVPYRDAEDDFFKRVSEEARP